MVLSSRVPIVVLVIGDQDRRIVAGISGREPFDIHFAESCGEARALATQLKAPVILFDRNWPGTEWRPMVESLAAAPHHPCVILISGVADDYLFQELIRQGGYDVLPKPLRGDHTARVLKLALTYWNRSSWNQTGKPAVTAKRS
jgi:DNA-binding NtrC family response regulator